MARQTEVVLLLTLAIAATTFASEVERLSDAYFEKLIKAAQERKATEKCSSCCPTGWVEFRGRCFIYQGSKLNWGSAERHCVNLGGHLASMQNENEYQLVKSIIRIYDKNENPTWIGLSSCQTKYNFFWSDGTKLTYTNWNPREPNRIFGECCVQMNYGSYKHWNDISCSRKVPFVCVKKLY
ncbi:lactose-binding lectin l-2-like [Clarias gariepinus]|uniref:lactose-binding lectin l-2-like n=1 Tax=Clarias gariepinus TaxID=13013 RepID=UPI00234E313E|nr:lactose-binding lectin l-2-like [Clarias gariepinus]